MRGYEFKTLSLRVPEYKRLKLLAIEDDRTMVDIVRLAIDLYEKHPNRPAVEQREKTAA